MVFLKRPCDENGAEAIESVDRVHSVDLVSSPAKQELTTILPAGHRLWARVVLRSLISAAIQHGLSLSR